MDLRLFYFHVTKWRKCGHVFRTFLSLTLSFFLKNLRSMRYEYMKNKHIENYTYLRTPSLHFSKAWLVSILKSITNQPENRLTDTLHVFIFSYGDIFAHSAANNSRSTVNDHQ